MARSDWFEEELIARALAGDTEARYALEQCAEGVLMGTSSARMRTYLHDRLREVIDGIDPAKALRIARPPVKPRDPFPEWEAPLAALAALAAKRGMKAEAILGVMDEARQAIERKPLGRTEAQRIRKTYKPMRDLDDDLLLQATAGPRDSTAPSWRTSW